MNITIKNIPARVHQILKKRAQLHRRSLNSEIILSLSSSLGLSAVDVDSFLEEVRHLRNQIKGHLTNDFINQAKNEGRL